MVSTAGFVYKLRTRGNFPERKQAMVSKTGFGIAVHKINNLLTRAGIEALAAPNCHLVHDPGKGMKRPRVHPISLKNQWYFHLLIPNCQGLTPDPLNSLRLQPTTKPCLSAGFHYKCILTPLISPGVPTASDGPFNPRIPQVSNEYSGGFFGLIMSAKKQK